MGPGKEDLGYESGKGCVSIDLLAADGMCSVPRCVRQAGETSWGWGFSVAGFTSGLLRYELCNAKHVGTFNHAECRSKQKKEICEHLYSSRDVQILKVSIQVSTTNCPSTWPVPGSC